MKKILWVIVILASFVHVWAQKKETKPAPVKEEKKDELPLPAIKFRNIGPAVTSGRIADFAVNPNKVKWLQTHLDNFLQAVRAGLFVIS